MLLPTSEPQVGEMHQTPEDKYAIPLTQGAQDTRIHGDRKKSGGCQGGSLLLGDSFWLEE